MPNKKSILVLIIFIQITGIRVFANDLNVNFNPKLPGPNETVSANINSYSIDLDRSQITWLINGEVTTKGIGNKNFSFNTGNNGSKTDVTIKIEPQEGEDITKQYIIRPAEIDLLWEGQTSVPPFYKGLALISPESEINIVVMPQIYDDNGLIPASKLVYKWQKDGKEIATASGYGKNYLKTKSSQSGKTKISVTASNVAGNLSAYKEITISAVQPKVILYEQKSLEGVQYNNSLKDRTRLTNSIIKLRAEPYFFSLGGIEKLKFNWFADNANINDSQNSSVVSFEKKNNQILNSNIKIIIKGSESPLQTAQKTLNIFSEAN